MPVEGAAAGGSPDSGGATDGNPKRIWVIGCPGSGKTSIAAALAARLGLVHRELDSFYHQANWTPASREDFARDLGEFVEQPRWVVDGNYNSMGSNEIVLPLVDLVVWPDLPRALVMRRVAARTIRRAVTRETLWNGNREPLTNFTSLKPEKNIVAWAWEHHPKYRERYETALHDGTFDHAAVARLTSDAEVATFLSSFQPSANR